MVEFLFRRSNNSSSNSTRKNKLKQEHDGLNDLKQVDKQSLSQTDSENDSINNLLDELKSSYNIELRKPPKTEFNLNLIDDNEIFLTKNFSSSPMVFATKILY